MRCRVRSASSARSLPTASGHRGPGLDAGLDPGAPRSYRAGMQWRSTVATALAALLAMIGGGRVCAQNGDFAADLAAAQRALDRGELTSAENAFQELVDAADEGPVAERPSA